MKPTDAPDHAEALLSLHADVERAARRLHVLHAERLQCGRGCSACCLDGLSVFTVEAARIRRHHPALLLTGVPHPDGACAFLDADGACRIYDDRPYVCRTQGLPLRWLEEQDPPEDSTDALEVHELRDICAENEAGTPLEELPADACWTLGPVEERLAELQLASGTPGSPARVRLRSLFALGDPPPDDVP